MRIHRRLTRRVATVGAIVVTSAVASGWSGVAAADPGDDVYVVRPGDGFTIIARRTGASVEAILAANELTASSTIHPGQQLVIPDRVTGDGSAAGTEPASTGATYTVRPGDGLAAIARRTGVGLDALLRANGLRLTSTIHPGQHLAVPPGSTSAAGPAAGGAPDAPAPTAATVHTVRSGESFASIAGRYGTSARALAEANGLTTGSTIHPGQQLRVPASTVPRQVAAHAHLVPVFRSAAAEAGIPADLLMAVAYHESRWQAGARSSAGAIGIGQLMPTTAAWIATGLMGEPALDPRRATDNIRMSAHYLAWLIRQGGTVDRGLAMYMQGLWGVRADGVSPAAVAYAAHIADLRRQFH